MTVIDTATDAAVTSAERATDVATTVAAGAADIAGDAIDAAVGGVQSLPVGPDRSPWRRRVLGLAIIAMVVAVFVTLRKRSGSGDETDHAEDTEPAPTHLQPAV